MKPQTSEWVLQAEGDFRSAEILLRSRRAEDLNAQIAYLYQQSGEKYLKAWVLEQGTLPLKTHDLRILSTQVEADAAFWMNHCKGLEILSSYAIRGRYPGEPVLRHDALEAMKIAREIRQLIRQRLGLD
ncbi:MAG: hypothetical protein GEEBNDBF_02685 [bacterium]|nr:hypothetical protein [bacterium]